MNKDYDEKNQKDESKAQKAADAEKEYNAGWDDAGSEKKADNTPLEPLLIEGKEEDEGLADKKPEGEGKKADEKPPESKSQAAEDASYEKALKDTKAWATKLAMENAELKKTLEAAKAGKASEQDVSDAKKAVEAAKGSLDSVRKKVYEDYPELEALLEPIIKQNNELGQKITHLESEKVKDAEEDKVKAAREHFEVNVKPEVAKTHPDFEDIIFAMKDGKRAGLNKEYFEWAEKQRPSLRVAALDSSDPQDIIFAVTEFKKFRGSDEAKELKQKEAQTKKDKLINAMSLRGGNASLAMKSGKTDSDDYEAGWNEAGKALKSQGVG